MLLGRQGLNGGMAELATVIRPVRPEEHEALGELTVRVYRQLLGRDMGTYAEVLRDVAGRVASSCEVLVAAEAPAVAEPARSRVVGGATYVPGPGPYAELASEREAEIRMLVVDPRAQGRGVGEALVRACIERAAASSRRALSLYTTDAMSAAQRLYARLGFVRITERDSRVGGLRLLCYSLDLGSPAAVPAAPP